MKFSLLFIWRQLGHGKNFSCNWESFQEICIKKEKVDKYNVGALNKKVTNIRKINKKRQKKMTFLLLKVDRMLVNYSTVNK